MPEAEASTFGRWAMPRGHLAPRVAKEVRKSFKWRRLPSSLGSGAEVLGVYLPVQVLPDKVAYDREDHHEGRISDAQQGDQEDYQPRDEDRKSTRLNSSHANISYAVFCLKKK